ncbi:MAG: NAD(P)H-hydrate dehydratase [Sulfurospirillum sp.]
MQKVFDEVLTLDRRCYEEFALSEDILMEHASISLCEAIKKRVKPKSRVFFLCGPGNNGGDGIACARILHKEYDVSICLPYGAKSKMARLQLKRYELLGGRVVEKRQEASAYVDALFGSGLRKKLDIKSSEMISWINSQEGVKVSCDIPSGIGMDFISDVVFKADVSISMGALKLPLFEDFAKDYIGDVRVADLGVAREVYESSSDIFLLEAKDMKLPFRENKNCNKGSFGHTCIIQGEKKGAALLSATAALNFGSGLVTVLTNDANDILPPYLMGSTQIPKNTTSLTVGMGLGNRAFGLDILLKINFPIVLDADMFYNPNITKLLETKDNIVLTPHPKEFASLLEICDIAQVDTKAVQANRFKYIRKFLEKFPKTTLILKGANTIITHNKKIYISTLGTAKLSKGGSGDVLSGLIGALLAQGYSTKDAAITSVLAHSIAANSVKINNYALNPLDICKEIKCL